MEKYILLTVALVLTACTPPQQLLAQCPPLGIDVSQPDFHQKHARTEIDQFYACMEGNAYLEARNMGYFQKRRLAAQGIAPDAAATSLLTALEYQKNLWQEVINRQKKPEAAREAWVTWAQNERAINAQNKAAYAAAKANRSAYIASGLTQADSDRVYDSSECIGSIVMGECHGAILPNTSYHQTCYGQMLNGQCTGPMF